MDINPSAGLHSLHAPALKEHEFRWIKDYLYRHAGIVLNDSKHALVTGRLEKRLRYHGIRSYSEYFRILDKAGFERETSMAIDLLTTNETYFFREPKHFDFLTSQVFPHHTPGQTFRIWSAASSSGEEAYTLAMLLAEFGKTTQWEIIGTDISTRILEKAQRGLYPLSAAEKIPTTLLKKYCLKGSGEYDGFFLIDPSIRARVRFKYANLIEKLPELGGFDVIFLRNVMIYFDIPTKQKLVERIRSYLRPGGYFIISHSESLNGISNQFKMLAPSIYQKPGHGESLS
ncbi:protein-glutamate O-methyltransferase CheR [Methylomonas sp. SURF-2]|uniref:Chemotaxis protein methyltransferase n=1 Tax=Methylomonas subterranea TaxID=2952225 RepID=A0ABT1TET4_9GAMM|nr:protein-glutamate O-methyltransferase CheR [Methylomonas sp. SURF-2]MCQ8103976.1 protein-glutamate O-methyltransferase CheR [Methylomonas sp. SURF-2]